MSEIWSGRLARVRCVGAGIAVVGAAGATWGSVVESHWLAPTSGAWLTAANWSNGVPANVQPNGPTYHAILPTFGTAAAYTVTLNQPSLSERVVLDDVDLGAGATLDVNGGNSFSYAAVTDRLTIEDGATLGLSHGEIRGGMTGRITTVGSGKVVASDSAYLADTVLAATIDVPASGNLNFSQYTRLDGAAVTLLPQSNKDASLVAYGLTGTGSVLINGTGTASVTASSNTFTIDPGVTLRTTAGTGRLYDGSYTPTFINRGTILVEGATASFGIGTNRSAFQNKGTVRVTNGGKLGLGNWTNTEGSIHVSDGMISIGAVPTTADGVGDFAVSNSTVDLVYSNTLATVESLNITGSTFVLPSLGGIQLGGLTMKIADGTNRWLLAGGGIANGTIVSGDVAGTPLTVRGGTAGSLLRSAIVDAQVDAPLRLEPYASLSVYGSGAGLTSPTVQLSDGAAFSLGNTKWTGPSTISFEGGTSAPVVRLVSIPADAKVVTTAHAGGTITSLNDEAGPADIDNSGLLDAAADDAPLTLGARTLTNHGVVRVTGDAARVVIPAYRVSGVAGTFPGRFTNAAAGIVQLGPAATLAISGDFEQQAGGVLSDTLTADANRAGRVTVNGALRLAGGLVLVLSDSLADASLGTSWTIAQGATREGQFTSVNGIMVAGSNDRALAITYSSTGAIATLTRPGDATLDAHVRFDDLLVLARHYNLHSVQSWSDGDFTGDGAVHFDDLLVLARNYGDPADASLLGSTAVQNDWLLAQALVPGPVTLGLPLFAIGLPRRRRGHH